jgi:hypothetical protein
MREERVMNDRKMALVAREGVLSQILDEYNFPTPNHRAVIESLYGETLGEMHLLGLEEVSEAEWKQIQKSTDAPKVSWDDLKD